MDDLTLADNAVGKPANAYTSKESTIDDTGNIVAGEFDFTSIGNEHGGTITITARAARVKSEEDVES